MSQGVDPGGQISQQTVLTYVDAQLSHDRAAALAMVDRLLTGGVPVTDVYRLLLQPAQYELGRMWQENRISVAQEHSGTAITQLVLAQMYSHLPRSSPLGRTAVTACVQGEHHDIGARMVADFFEIHGFGSIYLGADLPTDSLVDTVLDLEPDVLGLSVTMSFNLPALNEAIDRLAGLSTTSICVVGGGGVAWLDVRPGWWPEVVRTDAFSTIQRLRTDLAWGHES